MLQDKCVVTHAATSHETALQLLLCTDLPQDCLSVIREFMPLFVMERCFSCGMPVVMTDSRDRMHFATHIACSEAMIACEECFESFDM